MCHEYCDCKDVRCDEDEDVKMENGNQKFKMSQKTQYGSTCTNCAFLKMCLFNVRLC